VTEPDLRSPEEAEYFARMIQAILQAVNASDADMEKGMMRFDASISIREKGSKTLNPRAEIKNLNSFKMLRTALAYESGRQIEEFYSKGKKLDHDITVGWRDEQGKTVLLRDKETASDYRYFPEPDIPPMTFSKEEVEAVKKTIPELPLAKEKRYMKEYGLEKSVASQLSLNKTLSEWFEASLQAQISAKTVANILTSVLVGILNDKNMTLEKIACTREDFIELLTMLEKGTISHTAAKTVLENMIETGEKPAKIVEKEGLAQVSDISAIEELCRNAIAANPDAVTSFKNGKDRALGAIVGYVMKESKGKANPKMVDEMVRKLIK
jgi:aspartyl-tRNA(Asn)/glutamyl-tRNA(Gln) amidotransferase subunit B